MAGVRIGIALAGGLLAISGCSTVGLNGTRDQPPARHAGGFASGEAGAGKGRVAATIISAMAGGLIGGSIGTGLDERERRNALEAEYRALEYTQSGQPVSWRAAGPDGRVRWLPRSPIESAPRIVANIRRRSIFPGSRAPHVERLAAMRTEAGRR